KVDDLKVHYKNTHHLPNMRFVIAGNIKPSRKAILTKLLEAIELPSSGERFELPQEKPKRLSKPVYIANDTVENLYFYIDTFAKRRLNDSETDSLNLVNTMLTETLYSKILGTAREKGLVYSMNSGLSHTRNASNWWFGAQVSDKNAMALMKIIVMELQGVLEGKLSDEEIESTKQYALGRFQRSAQTVGGTAAGYAGRYFFDDVIEDYYRIPERIKAVNKRQIIDVAQAMFADSVWGFGVLGNCGEEFTLQLESRLKPLWAQPSIAPLA
ncbi:MAG TPA: insulinase family protein, partial [Candidatus Saccharimonadales bacterium]|nr:insulinase family protein [Candidatus Saccharimonadales bacterium]